MSKNVSPSPLPARVFQRRILFLMALALSLFGLVLSLPFWPQPLSYHAFADDRDSLGVPNLLNVVSNLPFVVIGAAGCWFVARPRAKGMDKAFLEPNERWPYLLFFAGVFFTGLGSSYYHLTPDNDRLVWDRLPMTVAFMAFFAAMLGDRIDPEIGLWLLGPLILIGIGSVINWHRSEQA